MTEETGAMRIKNNRCQRLIEITHDFEPATKTHKITKVWRDLERIILEQKLSSEPFGFKPLSTFCINYEAIPDEIEVE